LETTRNLRIPILSFRSPRSPALPGKRHHILGAMPSCLARHTRLLDISGRPLLEWSVTDFLDEDLENQPEFVGGHERWMGHGDTVVQIFLVS
jgi:hypothetical protein